MDSLLSARNIQSHMGGEVYWDRHYQCFRVMRCDSQSLHRWPEHYERINDERSPRAPSFLCP